MIDAKTAIAVPRGVVIVDKTTPATPPAGATLAEQLDAIRRRRRQEVAELVARHPRREH
jgi:hypothetical protein